MNFGFMIWDFGFVYGLCQNPKSQIQNRKSLESSSSQKRFPYQCYDQREQCRTDHCPNYGERFALYADGPDLGESHFACDPHAKPGPDEAYNYRYQATAKAVARKGLTNGAADCGDGQKNEKSYECHTIGFSLNSKDCTKLNLFLLHKRHQLSKKPFYKPVILHSWYPFRRF
jgi:hypothetical protein